MMLRGLRPPISNPTDRSAVRFTAAADRKRLSAEGMRALVEHDEPTNIVKPALKVRQCFP